MSLLTNSMPTNGHPWIQGWVDTTGIPVPPVHFQKLQPCCKSQIQWLHLPKGLWSLPFTPMVANLGWLTSHSSLSGPVHSTWFLLPQHLHSTLANAKSSPKHWGFPSWFLMGWVFQVSFLHTQELCLRRFSVYCGLPWSLLGKSTTTMCASVFSLLCMRSKGPELPRSQKNWAFWIFKSCCACDSGSQEQTKYYLQVSPQEYFCSWGVLTNLLEHVLSSQEPMYEVWETEKLFILRHSSWVLPNKYLSTLCLSFHPSKMQAIIDKF